MVELGLGPNDIGTLQKMEWAKLNAAATAVADNTKRCEQGTGNTPEAQKLAKINGHRMGNLRPHRQSQRVGPDLEIVRAEPLSDNGIRQPMPHGGRPRRRRTQIVAKLVPKKNRARNWPPSGLNSAPAAANEPRINHGWIRITPILTKAN